MAWRDQYETGSFRGAAFRSEGHERASGRRTVVHEFPDRDEPVVEDLGRRYRQFQIDCHVIGRDYRSGRDALIDALEGAGPGLLVHPWHGSMMVSVLEYSSSKSTEDGGMCAFHITFAEAGLEPTAPVAVAAGQQSATEADAAIAAAPGMLAGDFSIAGVASFVEDSAGAIISGMTEVSLLAAGLRGGTGRALRAFEAGLRFLPDNMAGLLRAPLDLGHALVGLVQAVSLIGQSGARQSRLTPLSLMLDWEPALPQFPVITPQREQEKANRTALLRIFRTSSAAELVRTAAAIDFASYEDAIAARDGITMRLDSLAIAAADRGDDVEADTHDRLRRAIVRDIAARGATLARIYSTQLATAEPALALAHRLYGGERPADSDPETRALAIAARNRVSHPGFIPGGVPLELLTRQVA